MIREIGEKLKYKWPTEKMGYVYESYNRAIDEFVEALLTAEPEPCEDNYVAYMRYSAHDGKPTSIAACDSWDKGAFKVYRHPQASKVADKRAEELREQVETLRYALLKSIRFAEQAYSGLRKLCDEIRFPHDRDYFEALHTWIDIKKETYEAIAATGPKP